MPYAMLEKKTLGPGRKFSHVLECPRGLTTISALRRTGDTMLAKMGAGGTLDDSIDSIDHLYIGGICGAYTPYLTYPM